MSKTIQIPTTDNPYRVWVNGKVYTYTAGEIVDVPDEVAEVIANNADNAPQERLKIPFLLNDGAILKNRTWSSELIFNYMMRMGTELAVTPNAPTAGGENSLTSLKVGGKTYVISGGGGGGSSPAVSPVMLGRDLDAFGSSSSTVYDIKIDADGNTAYATNGKTSNNVIKLTLGSGTATKKSPCPTGSDATDLPADMSAFVGSGSSFLARCIAVGTDYIYVGIRKSSGKADGVLLYGGIVVMKKSDFSVKKSYWTLGMTSGIALSPDGSLLAVANQMRGITFYTVASDGYTLTQAKQFLYDQSSGSPTKGWESQFGAFFTGGNGHLYYLNCGFALGYTIYDVTNTSNIVEVSHPLFRDLLPAEYGHQHAYSCVIDYPYAYCTVATDKEEIIVGGTTYCGVMVLNLSDPTAVTVESYTKIPTSDVKAWAGSVDSLPTVLVKSHNKLVLNYERGILVFEISANKKSTTYLGNYFKDFWIYSLAEGQMCIAGGGKYMGTGADAASIYRFAGIDTY